MALEAAGNIFNNLEKVLANPGNKIGREALAYANNNVKIVGTAPGITQGSNGGTHMCFQDLAIMRAMPNMHVYSPGDVYELKAVLKYGKHKTADIYAAYPSEAWKNF